MDEQRYSINPDQSIESPFWIADDDGDWIKRDDIYYHQPLERKQ